MKKYYTKFGTKRNFYNFSNDDFNAYELIYKNNFLNHGLYFYFMEKFYSKGNYNNGMEYSHWLIHEIKLKYFL